MKRLPDAVVRNRDAAYRGETGRRRLKFCLDYTAYKRAALAHGEKRLGEGVAAEGKRISCKKGCSSCCGLYVLATLQEAECVVHHLYRHEELLRHFVRAYTGWRRKIGTIVPELTHIDLAIARNLSTGLSPKEQYKFDTDINRYAGGRVPCPFLVDNCCAIYEVRPFACAAVVAVTPPVRCVPDASGQNQADYRKIEVKLEEEMPYFLKSRNSINFGCFPELVNRLLVEGYSFLAQLEWQEKPDVAP